MKAQFTPGPWRPALTYCYPHSKKPDFCTLINDSTNEWVFEFKINQECEKDMPNLHLISAAPDMLEALQQMVERCDALMEAYPEDAGMFRAITKESRDAIAKALGGNTP